MAQALDVVNRFYDATGRRRADELPALVAEDVSFAGPLMRATGRFLAAWDAVDVDGLVAHGRRRRRPELRGAAQSYCS